MCSKKSNGNSRIFYSNGNKHRDYLEGTSLLKNHMLRGIFEEMEKQNLPEKMIAAVKDTLECNPQFRGHLVSVEQMIMVMVGSIVLLGVLYLWMTSLREK